MHKLRVGQRPLLRGIIDSDREYHLALLELRQLDDMDDWPLFQQQEKLLRDENDYDCWYKYVIINR